MVDEKFVVHELLRHTLVNRPDSEIVSGQVRLTYEKMYERTLRLADRLGRMGIGRGTVVGVMDVNSHRYLELHYALSMLGAVIHTLNFRLSGEDLAYTIRHAEDEWLFVWDGFAEAAKPLRRLVPNWVWLSEDAEGPEPGTPAYEGLVEEGRVKEPESADDVDETAPYSLFYTTGTTGRPKGLLYRHRYPVGLPADGPPPRPAPDRRVGESDDVFMPLIPFFHIHGWGTTMFVPYLGGSWCCPAGRGPGNSWN